MEYHNYFHRQVQLWGEETQESLRKKSIAIIGSGGLGCSLAMALGTSGIGKIAMVDFDTVAPHNIHRQIAFTLQDEGRYKAEAVCELLARKNPFIEAVAYNESFETFSKRSLRFDLILDATDNLPARYQIDHYAKSHQCLWIYGSVEEFHGHVCLIDRANFSVFPLSDHKPGGIAAPIVMYIASLQANLALRYLAGLPVRKDKLYYLFFDQEGELQRQCFDMPSS